MALFKVWGNPAIVFTQVTGEVGDGRTRRYGGGFSFENFKILILMCLVKSARQFTSIFNVNLNLGFPL